MIKRPWKPLYLYSRIKDSQTNLKSPDRIVVTLLLQEVKKLGIISPK